MYFFSDNHACLVCSKQLLYITYRTDHSCWPRTVMKMKH